MGAPVGISRSMTSLQSVLELRMVLDLFRRRRNYTLSALTDFAVADLQGEDSAAVGFGRVEVS